MGGRAMALLNIETERKSTFDHLRIQTILKPKIAEMFNTEVKGVKFYRHKETHGDLDLLILNNGNLGNVAEKLKKEFGPVHCNGNVYSFEYEKYQVDVITQPTRNWETCSDFFDYDPTGNLMGKIAHKLGLKYGFAGLVFPFRTFSGRLSTDIIISKDSRKIFEFLGYDYDRYLEGFDTTQEIFDWIINGKYFCVDNFLMNNLNHVDRKRNAKRTTYQGFLEYINENDVQSKHTFEKDKSKYINVIDEFFPESNFKSQLTDLQLKDARNKLASERFNGNLVMSVTDLKGKELGNVIGGFKDFVENRFNCGFNDWVVNDSNDSAKITETFLNWFNAWHK